MSKSLRWSLQLERRRYEVNNYSIGWFQELIDNNNTNDIHGCKIYECGFRTYGRERIYSSRDLHYFL